MSRDEDISDSLISAVREGRLQTAQEIISSHGLSYSEAWSQGYSLLCDALENKHTEISKLLLTNNCKVNSNTREPTNTPLHFAAINGDIEVVEMLLDRGANANAENHNGWTPLHDAVKSKNMEIIVLLTSRGANVNAARGKDGVTFLHIAAEWKHLQIVEHLLNHGANVNSAYTAIWRGGYTPLFLAVENEDDRMVKLFLEHGANVDALDTDGKTILHFAVEKGRPVIIEHILKYCPDVNNKSNRNALNVAVYGYEEEYSNIVEKLLQYGFTVNPDDVNNGKLLHAAVKKGYLKIVEELLKYGTNVNMLYSGYMPLHVATKYNQVEMVILLIRYGADVNAQDDTKKVSLFYAIGNTDLKTVEVLLEHGADVNASDKNGKMALHLISHKRSVYFDDDRGKIAKRLLSRGANVNAQTNDGITPLHVAVDGGYVDVVEALLEYNADVNSVAKENLPPLHLAVQKGNEIITKMLLEHGADINILSRNNQTPLCFLSLTSNRVREILKNHIIKIKAANLYLTEKKLLSIIDNNYFQNECEKEIANMKSEKIGNSIISFYDVLTKSIYQLAIILENEIIVQILRSDDYKIKFPIYASMINIKFGKGKLLMEANKYSYNIFPQLPYYCTKYIFSYLSDADLRILVSVCQPANVLHDDLISSMSKRPRLI